MGRHLAADPSGTGPEHRWDRSRFARPTEGRRFENRSAFRSWILDHLRRDTDEAERGNVDSPVKAALDVLRDLRNEVRLAVDHGGLCGFSHRDDLYGWYTPLNTCLSIGPPALRVRELIALIEAGVVKILGPGTQVRLDTVHTESVADSNPVPGPPVHSRALIEARLPEPDLRRGEGPLLLHMVQSEQAGLWHAEWSLLRDCLALAGGVAHTLVELTEGIDVRVGRVRENLRRTGDTVSSERVAAALTPELGRARARELMTRCAAEAARTERSLAWVPADEPDVAERFTLDELTRLGDPAGFTGAATALVVRALEHEAAVDGGQTAG